MRDFGAVGLRLRVQRFAELGYQHGTNRDIGRGHRGSRFGRLRGRNNGIWRPHPLYTLVARGIHACWFGAGGPLSNTHVFRAEAQSPTKGGQAEIVIHERDVALTDQRGPQALRIAFENNGGVVRVATKVLKVPPGYGEPLTRDVETWAKGGGGCQLRASFPQPPATTAQKAPGKPSAKPGAKGTR